MARQLTGLAAGPSGAVASGQCRKTPSRRHPSGPRRLVDRARTLHGNANDGADRRQQGRDKPPAPPAPRSALKPLVPSEQLLRDNIDASGPASLTRISTPIPGRDSAMTARRTTFQMERSQSTCRHFDPRSGDANIASSETSLGRRMTRPVTPERIDRETASTSVVTWICRPQRRTAVRLQ